MLSFFQDCVPRLSLASVARLMSMARAVAALKLTVYQQMQVFAARLSGDMITEITANLKKVQEAIKDIDQDRFPFLEHPGQIHYLFSINGGNGGKTNNVPYNVPSSFSFQNTVRNSIFWSMSLHTHSLVTFFFWTKWWAIISQLLTKRHLTIQSWTRHWLRRSRSDWISNAD